MVTAENIIRSLDRLIISFKKNSRGAIQIDLPALTSCARVRCREISSADLMAVVDLLTIGFEDRNRRYWLDAIDRLSEHDCPAGFPKYGYLLECEGTLVGVILLIFSARPINEHSGIRCNGSSLYVAPPFRGYAPMLIKRALRFKDVTYLNVTPARHTWPMLKAQGYVQFASGQFVACLLLSRRRADVGIRLATMDTCRGSSLSQYDIDLLLQHAEFGCLSLICTAEGRDRPFVFGLRRKYGVPLAHLVYCHDQQDVVDFAGSLGRFLCKRGIGLVILDANSRIDGIAGRYFDIQPKFAMGPETVRLGDLPYTERPMFGF